MRIIYRDVCGHPDNPPAGYAKHFCGLEPGHITPHAVIVPNPLAQVVGASKPFLDMWHSKALKNRPAQTRGS